jgi:hypothetical protein
MYHPAYKGLCLKSPFTSLKRRNHALFRRWSSYENQAICNRVLLHCGPSALLPCGFKSMPPRIGSQL